MTDTEVDALLETLESSGFKSPMFERTKGGALLISVRAEDMRATLAAHAEAIRAASDAALEEAAREADTEIDFDRGGLIAAEARDDGDSARAFRARIVAAESIAEGIRALKYTSPTETP